VIDVELARAMLVAAEPPIVTVGDAGKFVPPIVTFVPPAVVPHDGEMLVTVSVVDGVVLDPHADTRSPIAKRNPDLCKRPCRENVIGNYATPRTT
jgi:hypothetical protein